MIAMCSKGGSPICFATAPTNSPSVATEHENVPPDVSTLTVSPCPGGSDAAPSAPSGEEVFAAPNEPPIASAAAPPSSGAQRLHSGPAPRGCSRGGPWRSFCAISGGLQRRAGGPRRCAPENDFPVALVRGSHDVVRLAPDYLPAILSRSTLYAVHSRRLLRFFGPLSTAKFGQPAGELQIRCRSRPNSPRNTPPSLRNTAPRILARAAFRTRTL